MTSPLWLEMAQAGRTLDRRISTIAQHRQSGMKNRFIGIAAVSILSPIALVDYAAEPSQPSTIPALSLSTPATQPAVQDVLTVALPTTQTDDISKDPSILLVSDGDVFLETALKVQKHDYFDEITIQEYSQLSQTVGGGKKLPEPYQIIIFEHDTDLKPGDLPVNTAAVFINCVPPGSAVKAVLDPSGSPRVDSEEQVLSWNDKHPILQGLKLDNVSVTQATRISPMAQSEILIKGTKGPLMILYRQERVAQLIVPFDLKNSNLPLKSAFPQLIYQIAQYFANGPSNNGG